MSRAVRHNALCAFAVLHCRSTDSSARFLSHSSALAKPSAPEPFIELAGLEASARIVIDRWSVPHIYGARDHSPVGEVSTRVVLDVRNLIDPRFVNGSGQSGDSASLSYGDMFAVWAAGGTATLLFTADAISRQVARAIEFITAKPR